MVVAAELPLPTGWEFLDGEDGWQLFEQLQKRFGRRRYHRWFPRLPYSDWDWPWAVEYKAGQMLYVADPDGQPGDFYDKSHQNGPDFDRLIRDFYEKSLLVVRELTTWGGFIYAMGDFRQLRFRPHEVEAKPLALKIPETVLVGGERWGVTEGDDTYFAPDFSWAFSFNQYDVRLFGEAVIDAFERHKPQVFREPRPS